QNAPLVSLQAKANLYDFRAAPHRLLLNFNEWRSQGYLLSDILSALEKRYFPALLLGHMNGSETVMRSFDAALRQHLVASDTPPPGTSEKPGQYYHGSLMHRKIHHDSLTRRLPALSLMPVTNDQ